MTLELNWMLVAGTALLILSIALLAAGGLQ